MQSSFWSDCFIRENSVKHEEFCMGRSKSKSVLYSPGVSGNGAYNTALQQSNVKLTWDETDPKCVKAMMRK